MYFFEKLTKIKALKDEGKALCDAGKFKDLYTFLIETGIRATDVFNLKQKHISENYFGEDEWRKGKASTYKPPTTTPPLTIEQMKTALKNSGGPYDLNAPDEQIRKMYKKYIQSLLKSTKKKTTTFTPDFPSGGIK